MFRLAGGTLLAVLWAWPVTAQSSDGWALSVGVEGLRFGATALDTFSEAGAAVGVRPSGRLAARVALHRDLGALSVGLAVGLARGNVEAANDAVAIRDHTADLSRYRAEIVLEHRLMGIATGALAAEVGPTMDLWSLEGETRTRAGLQAGLMLHLPLGGGLELENRLVAGLSASPLEAADLGSEFEVRKLRMVGFGVGLRARL